MTKEYIATNYRFAGGRYRDVERLIERLGDDHFQGMSDEDLRSLWSDIAANPTNYGLVGGSITGLRTSHEPPEYGKPRPPTFLTANADRTAVVTLTDMGLAAFKDMLLLRKPKH